MRRDAIDFHAVEEKHGLIHSRLENWARWCNGVGHAAASPMFRLYRSSDARNADRIAFGGAPVDKMDAAKIAKAVTALPEQHRAAINWSYVKPVNPRRAASSIGTSIEGLHNLVRNGRQMLINRRA
jgi:hypothetical protein